MRQAELERKEQEELERKEKERRQQELIALSIAASISHNNNVMKIIIVITGLWFLL